MGTRRLTAHERRTEKFLQTISEAVEQLSKALPMSQLHRFANIDQKVESLRRTNMESAQALLGLNEKVHAMAIEIKKSRRGLLHRKLGVPQGNKIPASKIAKAKRSSSPALRKEANFAQNAKKWGK